jgi:hypothetical protein
MGLCILMTLDIISRFVPMEENTVPKVYGKEYTKKELLDRVGDMSQIAGVKRMTLSEGREAGVDVVEFRVGEGFSFYVLPGRGMDITSAEHNGRSLAWRAAAGESSANFFEPEGLGWLRNFPGGLVATCGMTYAGAPCEDLGEPLGLHGRMGNTPATNVWVDAEWVGDDYVMWAQGKVREARLFGENIVLTRKVSAVMGSNKIMIDDVVENVGARKVPHMMLYHINGGFPAVDEGSLLVSPTKSATPRDAEAEIGKETYNIMDAPTFGYAEKCYYHDLGSEPDGTVLTALINKNLPGGENFGFYVKYNINELPKFTEWKMMGNQEYVVGMEPANCWVEGRGKERERGTLKFLKPGEKAEYHLEIGVLTTPEEVVQFEKRVELMRTNG